MGEKHNTLSVASLVLGILALISILLAPLGGLELSFPDELILFLLFLSLICGLSSIILGAANRLLRKTKDSNALGLALGVIVLTLLLIIVLLGILMGI